MKVYNKRENYPADAVYIGRPSIWGNPFVIGKDGTREEVIKMYEEFIRLSTFHMNRIKELEGKDLVCWCSPLPCHGDVLLKIANGLD